MTSTNSTNGPRVDIFSAAERAAYLAQSLEQIVELIAKPVAETAEGDPVDAVTAVRAIKGEEIEAAFEGREVALPFSAEQAVAALIERMRDLYLAAESIELLASDISMHLGGPEFAEEQ